jgi:hypothetical protein
VRSYGHSIPERRSPTRHAADGARSLCAAAGERARWAHHSRPYWNAPLPKGGRL